MNWTWIVLLSVFTFRFALAQDDCGQIDGTAYTLYVYAPTDASVLNNQSCDGSEQVKVSNVECHCYDKTLAQVLKELNASEGPVPVNTRDSAKVAGTHACEEALRLCNQSCKVSAQGAPVPCSLIQTGGIQ